MAEEPDNLVLQMLREIRTTLDVHTERFDAANRRLDRIEGELKGMKRQFTYMVGLAAQAEFQAQDAGRRVDEVAQRVEELFEHIEEGEQPDA